MARPLLPDRRLMGTVDHDKRVVPGHTVPRRLSAFAILGFFLLCVSRTLCAAPVMEIGSDHISTDLFPYIDVLEDKKGSLALDDITGETLSRQFSPSSLTDLYFGYTESVFWLRFAVENRLDHDKELVLEVTPADIDFIDFYTVDASAGTVLQHKRSGSAINVSERDYQRPLYYFDLKLPPKATQEYYVRLASNKTLNAQLRLSAVHEQFQWSMRHNWWQGFIFGGLCFLGAIHLGFAVVFRQKVFVYGGLLLISMVLVQASWSGYFIRFFNTDDRLLDRQLIFSVYLSAAIGLLFTRSYLDTHRRSPFIHRVLTALVVIAAAGLPCSWLFSSRANALLSGIVTVPAIFFMYGAAVYSFFEGYRPARYFLLARTITIVMILGALFSDQGYLTQGFINAWGLSVAMLFEGVVFAFALVRQYGNKTDVAKPVAGEAPQMTTSSVPVSAFCHELRTPISGVLGMSELLLDTALNEHQRLQAETIHSSGRILLDVVTKMSDIAALESGNLALSESSFEILAVVESGIEHARHLAERRNIELIYQVDETLSGFVKGDEEKLRQTLESLVNYGARHLESGEILLTARYQSHDYVQFEVVSGKNTFINEYQPQLDSVLMPTSADTMNITLARRYVTLMGGELTLVPRGDGGGYKASFQIFLRRQQRAHDANRNDDVLRGKRLVVIDDNDTCCKIVRQQATQWGMDVKTAANGREALALLRELKAQKEHIDLMLVDYDMPGMNGLELVARIRQEPAAFGSEKTLILMLTGVSKMAQGMEKNAGIHRVLYKPLSGKNLRQALIEALQPPTGGRADAKP